MEDSKAPILKLVRWPPTHGHWYLAYDKTPAGSSAIEFENPPEPAFKVCRDAGRFMDADYMDYPNSIGGAELKRFACNDPLQVGDNVLARIYPAPGMEHRMFEYGHEMGRVVQLGGDLAHDEALIGFSCGVSEAVSLENVRHMVYGGPTRLDHAGRGIYPRAATHAANREGEDISLAFDTDTSIPLPHSPRIFTRDLAGSSALIIAKNDEQRAQPIAVPGRQDSPAQRFGNRLDDMEGDNEFKALLAAVQSRLDDPNYIKRLPADRKAELSLYVERFEKFPKKIKSSDVGKAFKLCWAVLVKRHHHNLPFASQIRVNVTKHWKMFDEAAI